MKHAASKLARTRSHFISSILSPVRHTEAEVCCGFLETVLAVALVFGTVALMRLTLVFLGSGLPMP